MIASVVSTALSGVLGFFFCFAGVSKLTPFTPMSQEVQNGFRSGLWPTMWALPSMPFMYFVGATELLSGLGLFGYVFGIAPQLIAQWAAVVPPSIMIAASTSHVLNGDPPGTSGFAAALAGLFIINNFAMAFYFAGSKAKAA